MKTILTILMASLVVANAQTKVSERAALTGAALAPAEDVLPIVDTSAGLTGSKKITINQMFTGWGFTATGEV